MKGESNTLTFTAQALTFLTHHCLTEQRLVLVKVPASEMYVCLLVVQSMSNSFKSIAIIYNLFLVLGYKEDFTDNTATHL